MASTTGGFATFSASATSESVSVTEKIAEDNEESETESVFTNSEHPKPLIFSSTFSMIEISYKYYVAVSY